MDFYMSLADWKALTPFQRVLHYNRTLRHGCTHEANLMDWPEDLREEYSFDPYAHVSHSDVVHTAEAFFEGTCECNGCVKNVGIERDSVYEYEKRKKGSIRKFKNGALAEHTFTAGVYLSSGAYHGS